MKVINSFEWISSSSDHQRSIIFPGKSFLYNCLHRNWIRAYSFSNLCLSCVFSVNLYLKHYHPNLVHPSSPTFYSLPLTLVEQILTNFNTFHLFIMSISTLQYFIRYYRLLTNKYSINIYNGRNLLITKHTGVALILSGSLALIFGYNYIFYAPKHSQTLILLPLITLNVVLLPMIDIFIFIFIVICWIIDRYQSDTFSMDQQSSDDQCLTDNLRSLVEKTRCIKCYSKFLQLNRNLLQDTDPYTKLHSRFFSHTLISSGRPSSITLPDQSRKYSTVSYEHISIVSEQKHDRHQRNQSSRIRSSYPCQNTRSFKMKKLARIQQDFLAEQRNSTNDLFFQTALIKLKENHSICHRCYRLLIIFLFKYVLLTFPQHYIQMIHFLRQFSQFLRRSFPINTHSYISNDYHLTIIRLLFLFARFGDSFLLTHLTKYLRKYFPCWCRFNSKIFRQSTPTERVSHQILMKNTESSTHERASGEETTNGHEGTQQQQEYLQRISIMKELSKRRHRRFHLRFQFVPLCSKKQEKFFREHS